MRTNVLIVLLLLAANLVFAQGSNKVTPLISYAKAATVNPSTIQQKWAPEVVNLEAAFPGGNSYRSFLLREKAKLKPKNGTAKTGGIAVLGDAPELNYLQGFETNPWDGSVPCDNDVAISNGNKLISVVNSNIQFYDMDEDSLYMMISLEDFAASLNLPQNMYDPKLIYDPNEDKFIMIYLSGNNDSTSNIIVSFSTTNDPMDPWNIYALSGNPLNDGVWSDYPIVAISDDELFITVNALINDTVNTSDSWKFLFKESYIWQIDKEDGYTGGNLDTKVWNDVRWNGKPIRNLCPIQGGSGTYGPNMYLLSNRNFDASNDTIFMMEVPNNLAANPFSLNISAHVATTPYGLAPDGIQPTTANRLQTNDSRVLGGYLESGILHFVGNSVLPDSNRAGVYHGYILDIENTPIVKTNVIGDYSMDFGYPNISYTGLGGDDQAMITFNHTSIDSAAGISAVFHQGGFEYSERKTLKEGETFINILSGNNERWGDYSGTQRKYNEPGKVWMAAMFGARRTIQGQVGRPRFNLAFVAEVESPVEGYPVAIEEPSASKTPTIKTFPNPFVERFTVEFELQNEDKLTFQIYDMQGKLVKTLLSDRVKKGTNRFAFSIDPLAQGNYELLIMDSGLNIILQESVVKQ